MMRKRIRAVKIVLGILYLAVADPDTFLAGFNTGKKMIEENVLVAEEQMKYERSLAVCNRTNLH